MIQRAELSSGSGGGSGGGSTSYFTENTNTGTGVKTISYDGNITGTDIVSTNGQRFTQLYADIYDIMGKMNSRILSPKSGVFYVNYKNLLPPPTNGTLKYDGGLLVMNSLMLIKSYWIIRL